MRQAIICCVVGCCVVAVALAAGCKKDAFKLSRVDNDPKALQEVLEGWQSDATPVNQAGKSLAYLVTKDGPKSGQKIVAYDLAKKSATWSQPDTVDSRLVASGKAVLYLSGKFIKARSTATGKLVWKTGLGGQFVGMDANRSMAFVTVKTGRGRWSLRALDASDGSEAWSQPSAGALGAPTAAGGYVLSPYLRQWLAILDPKGKQVARIRAVDDEIGFAKRGSNSAFFGSRRGIYALDKRAAAGTQSGSTYAELNLPKVFKGYAIHFDAYDQVQSGYSAYDRKRLLWFGDVKDKKLSFSNTVAVLAYRFMFGLDPESAEIRWAYRHGKGDIVAAARQSAKWILLASDTGMLRAVSATNGGYVDLGQLDGRITGATFDAAGFSPKGQVESSAKADVLGKIALDRDKRLREVKLYVIEALEKSDDQSATTDLIALIADPLADDTAKKHAVEALVARKDPKAVPHFVQLLEVKHDYLAEDAPVATGALALALANIPNDKLEDKLRERAIEALSYHLHHTKTSDDDLSSVMKGLEHLGPDGKSALRQYVTMYRVSGAPLMEQAFKLLASSQRPVDREFVLWVANHSSTNAEVASAARRALTPVKPAPQ